MKRTACCLFLLLGSVATSPALAAAQSWAAQPGTAAPTPAGPTQVISGNPFGLVLDLLNAEYERRAGTAVTVGAGASRYMRDRQFGGGDYVNGDVFVRYFPGGQVFEGRSFGVKAGMTRFPGSGGTYFGVGVDANQT